ncbi:MAG: FecR domain-containing protein [Crocinitomicaceae bacterium]|nr:FecR domain-containing protein [Crocinitomicaceae bacterium]
MESKKEIEDDALGRWLSGDMSPEELKEFEASEAFKTYENIKNYTEGMKMPAYDLEKEFALLNDKRKGKVVQLNPMRKWTIAASIAIILGLGSLLFLMQGDDILVSHTTAQMETDTIALPDQSTVYLNADSKLDYNESSWEEEKVVELEGEGYFSVTKGDQFSVKTDQGTIQVLGTEFNIRSRSDLTEVTCYSGKVKVSDQASGAMILEPGMSCKIVDGSLVNEWTPNFDEKVSWLNSESTFHEAPFIIVIEELEDQYGVSIDDEDVSIKERVYTGTFPHGNLEDALKIVFDPMNIQYDILSEKEIKLRE